LENLNYCKPQTEQSFIQDKKTEVLGKKDLELEFDQDLISESLQMTQKGKFL